ncbi:MAG: hypothetical protein COA44_06210 [Arcobacter sp.]|nr:MAG: hypothetical protein COA44_06210 [Arcobacter sp.]
MSLSIIGYQNLLETATVTATSEAVGFAIENLYDGLAYDWWKPAAIGLHYINIDLGSEKEVDYISIFAHNLGDTSSTVKLQYDEDGLGNWTDATTTLTSENGRVIFKTLTPFNKQFLRLEVDAQTAIPTIGIVNIGKSMQMQTGLPSGFIPPTMGMTNDYVNAKSDSGLLIGRSLIRKSNSTTIKANYVTPAWVRTTWMPFISHAQVKPFFFSWDPERYPDEAVYCVTSKKITPPKYSGSLHMNVSLKVEAWHEL